VYCNAQTGGAGRPKITPGSFEGIGVKNMLYTIAVILVILWLLGLVTSYTMGGFIHLLLVVAIVIVLVRVISGRAVI
jgi:hypothetical protein